MKNKKIFISIGIICICIIVILIIFSIAKRTKNREELIPDNQVVENNISNNFEKEKEENLYFVVKNCVEIYINSIVEKSTDITFDLLYDKYAAENNLTKDNIYENSNFIINSHQDVFIDKMLKRQEQNGIYTFYVEGKMREFNNPESVKTSFYLIVVLDTENMTFSIIPGDYLEKNKITDINDYKNEIEKIEANDNNFFEDVFMEDETMAAILLGDFQEKILDETEDFYNVLNAEYRKKKFENIEEYKKYVEANKERILDSYVTKYAINEYDGYKEYIIVDQYNNYYVFDVESVMEYTMMLDIYTLPLEENIETYNEANDQQKVAININKWIMALNNRDYKYMHSVLNKTFAQNHFSRVEDLANFMSQNFYENNQLSLTRYQVEGTTHIYSLSVINAEDETQTKEFNIMMRLNEDNTFEMSFGE